MLSAAGCASSVRGPLVAPVAAPVQASTQLVVDQPTPGALQREAELEVRGHFSTATGKAWIYVESVAAEIAGDRFVARRVPLREGKMDLRVELTDGGGKKTLLFVPIVVETPDRPRTSEVCDAGTSPCLRVEVRGVPRRDESGRITNAVVVLNAFGFDERLDEMWPELIGPARPLDPRHFYILGVSPARGEQAPRAAEVPALLARLWTTAQLGSHAVVIGASSYGSELALRALAAGAFGKEGGPLLLCGGHDRPFAEQPMRRLRQIFLDAAHTARPAAEWEAIATVAVSATYTEAYLKNNANAEEHGLDAEAKTEGFWRALIERSAALWSKALTLGALGNRVEDAFALEQHPLVWPSLAGRRVVFVANERDRTSSIAQVRASAERLTAAGARVEVRSFDDELGHAAFFQRVPSVLARAVLDVVGEAGKTSVSGEGRTP